VQGSVGAKGDGERFGKDYELPNATAYNETCAAIANVYWNERMFLLHGDSKYIDVLEKTLYNGLLSGIGLDGKSFFYTNAMQVTAVSTKQNSNGFTNGNVEAERSGWFECSCCPTNLVRFIPSVPGYIYAQKEDNLYINLFISGSAELTVHNHPLQIIQQNNYPWEGNLQFTVNPLKNETFALKIRIPGWARNEAMPSDLYQFQDTSGQKTTIHINGQAFDYKMEQGYAVINRTWKKNDRVTVELPMEIRRVVANEQLQEDRDKVALQRGPIMYCAEWADNNGSTSNILLPDNLSFTNEYQPDKLNGIMVLKSVVPVSTVQQPFTAIPYYAWANRGKGEMRLWFPKQIKDIEHPL
jgi:DUF1680 family protein